MKFLVLPAEELGCAVPQQGQPCNVVCPRKRLALLHSGIIMPSARAEKSWPHMGYREQPSLNTGICNVLAAFLSTASWPFLAIAAAGRVGPYPDLLNSEWIDMEHGLMQNIN